MASSTPSKMDTTTSSEGTPLLISTSASEEATTPRAGRKELQANLFHNNNNKKNRIPRKRNNAQAQQHSNPFLQQKSEEIELLLSQPEIDLWKLREYALSPGGLVNDTIRKRAWPKLVGLDQNYEPLPLDDIIQCMGTIADSTSAEDSAPQQPQQAAATTTIEIDAQHELLQPTEQEKKVIDLPPTSTLLVESMDSQQIDRDVARCTWHLLTGSQRSRVSQHRSITHNSTRGTTYHQSSPKKETPAKRGLNRQQTAKYRRNRKIAVLMKKKQNRLANLINLTLVQSYDRSDGKAKNANQTKPPSPNRLRYYQGYHDVACIFLHALGGGGTNQLPTTNRHYSSGDLELPSKVLCQVSFSHFKDALRSDFLRLQTGLKLMLFPLLRKIDVEVHDHLLDADMEPFFCLSWILTWFAHDVRDTALVKRLFDAFMVAHPALPVYAALAMITHPHNRRLILETDCDFAALHQCLASLPKHSCKVGYKEQKVDGAFGNVVTYVSDDECDNNTNNEYGASPYGGGEDNNTVNTNTMDSYLDEMQSEFDDDDSNTFDTRSHYTSDTFCTESSFPTSIQSCSIVSSGTAPLLKANASLASGSLASLQEDEYATDRTLISTEQPDFMSKESTLVSGTWNDAWGDDNAAADDNDNNTTDAAGNPVLKQHDGATDIIHDFNPVPFEAVLDTALEFMNKYPPGSLADLAKKYYQDDWESQLTLLAHTQVAPAGATEVDVQQLIGLLQPTPPAWSILPFASSDWVDKQKIRQDLGLKPTSRKDRRKRKNKLNDISMSMDLDELPFDLTMPPSTSTSDNNVKDPMEYVRSNPEDRVVAAVGYATGIEAKKKQRQLLRKQKRLKKRKQALMVGCGMVVVGAILYHGLYQRKDNRRLLQPSQGATEESFSDCPSSIVEKPKQRKAETMQKAASILLPRLNSLNSKQLPEPPKTKKTTTILPPQQLTARTVKTPTTAAAPTNPQSIVVPNSKTSEQETLRLSNHTKLGNTLLLDLLKKTKFVAVQFLHNLWNVCRGFFIGKFHFFGRKQHPHSF